MKGLVRSASMMKRKEDEKGSLEPIPLDLKKKKLHVVLPYDMEVETLSRLPGKSLMRFLCVSKTWSSLIRSQRFVASYYAKKPSRFVVAFSNSVSGDSQRLFIFSGEEEETMTSLSSSLVANLDMTIPEVTLPYCCFRFSSVHGFLAWSVGLELTICNPSTGQVITSHCKAINTCLGYDPVDDQFKALTLLTSRYDLIHNPSLMCMHEVIRFGRGGRVVSRTRQVTSPPYRRTTVGLSINGFIYYGASLTDETPVFVCFDVRHERILSFITTPADVLAWQGLTSLIEYKGKPAVVVPDCSRPGGLGYSSFDRFDLWILEDVTKHEWSRQSCQLPFFLPFTLGGKRMISQGTNKAGEIIFSPITLPRPPHPLYVFYFNPLTKSTTRVRIHGVADTEEFWSRYGLTGTCCASFSPQHDDTIAFI